MLAKTIYELHYNCHEMVDLGIPCCVGGQEIFFKCAHFSLVLGITVISRAWLYFIRSFQKSRAKQKQQKKHPPTHFHTCKCVQVWENSQATTRVWRRFIPVLLGLGTRTSAMALMIVLFPLRLLIRSIILSVISLIGFRSRRWSSVDWRGQEES